MTSVTIAGWKEGLNKAQLNRLLRRYGGYNLEGAEHAVDHLLEGQSVTFEALDLESATEFCLSACEIGAVCHAGKEAQNVD